MNFTIMNAAKTPLEERGYRLSQEHETIVDPEMYQEVLIQKGKDHAEKIIADFKESGDCEPVCIDTEEGIFYTVLFENISLEGEEPAPTAIAWHEIEVIIDRK